MILLLSVNEADCLTLQHRRTTGDRNYSGVAEGATA
jgi:hypothetical protein